MSLFLEKIIMSYYNIKRAPLTKNFHGKNVIYRKNNTPVGEVSCA